MHERGRCAQDKRVFYTLLAASVCNRLGPAGEAPSAPPFRPRSRGEGRGLVGALPGDFATPVVLGWASLVGVSPAIVLKLTLF